LAAFGKIYKLWTWQRIGNKRLPSALAYVVQPIRDSVQIVVEQVGEDVERDGGGGVSEHPLSRLHDRYAATRYIDVSSIVVGRHGQPLDFNDVARELGPGRVSHFRFVAVGCFQGGQSA
jgi:hypothetical protein